MRFLALGILTLATLAFGGTAADDCVNAGRPANECINEYYREQGWGADNGVYTAQRLTLNAGPIGASADVLAKADAMVRQAEAERASANQLEKIHANLLTNGASLTTAVSRDDSAIAALEKLQKAAQASFDAAQEGTLIFGRRVATDGRVLAEERAQLDKINEQLARAKESRFANQTNLDALNKIATDAKAAPVNQPTP
jgi:hypothetical protein